MTLRSGLLHCFHVWSPIRILCSQEIEAALRDGAMVLCARMGAGDERQLQRAIGAAASSITPTGLDKGMLTPEDLLEIDMDGSVLGGKGSLRRRRACTR